MKEPIKRPKTPLNKEEFTKAVTELMCMVARARASSITFTSSELVTFTNHLYEYVAGLHAAADVDTETLARALIHARKVRQSARSSRCHQGSPVGSASPAGEQLSIAPSFYSSYLHLWIRCL